MPLVNVKLIKGVLTQAQKQEMIRKLTDAMVSIEGENLRHVTWVVIEEVESGDWGVGGNCLTTGDVMALAAGKETSLAANHSSRRASGSAKEAESLPPNLLKSRALRRR
jgi:4-oxalocrotonate tautomerase